MGQMDSSLRMKRFYAHDEWRIATQSSETAVVTLV